MTDTGILLLLYADACICIGAYLHIRTFKKLIGFHLGMNISNVMGGMAAMLAGVLLIQQFPFHFTWITLVSTLIGLLVGAAFGLLFDYQTFVTGLTNGAIVGLMAPMIGTVIEMQLLFVWFVHGLFVLLLYYIYISIRRS